MIKVSFYDKNLLKYQPFILRVIYVLANQGLDFVIGKSIPVLLVLYPITATVIMLLAFNLVKTIAIIAKRISIALVSVASILSVAGVQLPLKAYSMEWLPFAIGGLMIGVLFDKFVKQTN